MKNIKFSIIIPAYNVEKYIAKTIESILSQKYNNFELIVVDDGSYDNTVNIIKKFDDSRIKLFCQKNSGVSSARNKGISESSGDYIVFVDSDDYIEDWTLLEISKKINTYGKDITFIGLFNTVYEQDDSRICDCIDLDKRYIDNNSIENVLDYLYKKRIIYTVWRFIVPRNIIIENNLYFTENIIHEDEEWVPCMLACSKEFKLIEKPFYNYRIRNNSIMTTLYDDLYEEKCLINVSQKLLEYAANENAYKKNLFLRNAYKNLFQAYLKIREKACPIEPDREKVDIKTKKNILIYGSSRSGKTTLANLLKYKLMYSVISLDNIVSGLDKGFPILKIDRDNRDGTCVNILKPFIESYIKSLFGVNQKLKKYNYIVEGAFFDIDILKKYKNDSVILVLITGYSTPMQLFNSIRKNDNASDWTSNLNDEELLAYCKNVINNEKYIKSVCENSGFKYIETGINRVKVFDEILEKIERMIKD